MTEQTSTTTTTTTSPATIPPPAQTSIFPIQWPSWVVTLIAAWVPATILGFLWINSSISKHETQLAAHTKAHEQFGTLDKEVSICKQA